MRRKKLLHVKDCIIEILNESSIGVSFAQLPILLKKKLGPNFNINQIGFTKLKDLLKSMEDVVKIEMKGQNFPFAVLKNSSYSPNLIYHNYNLKFQVKPLNEDLNRFNKDKAIEFNKQILYLRNIIIKLLYQNPNGILC